MAAFVCFTSISKLLPFCNHLQRRSSSSPSPSCFARNITCSTTVTDKRSYWSSINKELAMELERAVPMKEPLVVYEPMRHSIFSSPKTMAPALCVAACELVGGERNQAMPAACAFHIMHAAFVAHEDMPALLDCPAPSTHATFGVNLALMSSDALFPAGYQWVARSIEGVDDEIVAGRVLRVILEITHAMGSEGLVDGQHRLVLLASEAADHPRTADWTEHVLEKRDGGFYACAAACGAILGGGSEDEIERLRRFGMLVGKIYGMLEGFWRGGKQGMSGDSCTGYLNLGVEGIRSFALKELQGFQEGKAAALSSLVDNFGSGIGEAFFFSKE